MLNPCMRDPKMIKRPKKNLQNSWRISRLMTSQDFSKASKENKWNIMLTMTFLKKNFRQGEQISGINSLYKWLNKNFLNTKNSKNPKKIITLILKVNLLLSGYLFKSEKIGSKNKNFKRCWHKLLPNKKMKT